MSIRPRRNWKKKLQFICSFNIVRFNIEYNKVFLGFLRWSVTVLIFKKLYFTIYLIFIYILKTFVIRLFILFSKRTKFINYPSMSTRVALNYSRFIIAPAIRSRINWKKISSDYLYFSINQEQSSVCSLTANLEIRQPIRYQSRRRKYYFFWKPLHST